MIPRLQYITWQNVPSFLMIASLFWLAPNESLLVIRDWYLLCTSRLRVAMVIVVVLHVVKWKVGYWSFPYTALLIASTVDNYFCCHFSVDWIAAVSSGTIYFSWLREKLYGVSQCIITEKPVITFLTSFASSRHFHPYLILPPCCFLHPCTQ